MRNGCRARIEGERAINPSKPARVCLQGGFHGDSTEIPKLIPADSLRRGDRPPRTRSVNFVSQFPAGRSRDPIAGPRTRHVEGTETKKSFGGAANLLYSRDRYSRTRARGKNSPFSAPARPTDAVESEKTRRCPIFPALFTSALIYADRAK